MSSETIGGRPRRPATIADVARLAGVSPMTVSRVINGEAYVRETKRDAVNAAIRELNYVPNPAARSLAAGDVVRLGLLYSNPSSAYLSEFLVGVLDQCRRSHVQLTLEKSNEGAEETALQELLASGLEGIVLIPPLCDNQTVLATLARHDLPAVAVAVGRRRDDLPSVWMDDYSAALEMTRHLLGLGHRRIGFIKGNPKQAASDERLRGYLDALVEAKVAAAPELVVQGYFSYRSGLDAAEQLLDLPGPPTAVFAANDDMAAATIAVAHRRSLDVPRQLSVCGFDDSASATNVWPELTTIHQPIAEMARRAVALLAEEIHARAGGANAASESLLLPYRLVRRQSDAPPP